MEDRTGLLGNFVPNLKEPYPLSPLSERLELFQTLEPRLSRNDSTLLKK